MAPANLKWPTTFSIYGPFFTWPHQILNDPLFFHNVGPWAHIEKLMQYQDLQFKIWGNIVIDQAKAVIEKQNMFDKDEYDVNDRCSHKFMEMLKNLYLPTLPVWSNIRFCRSGQI